MNEEKWVEIWHGEDPGPPGRKLEAAGIEMRITARGWGAHGGGLGFSFTSLLFRRKHQSRLLVREIDRERANAALK